MPEQAYKLCIQSQTLAGRTVIAQAPALVDDATVGRLLPPAEVLAVIDAAFVDPVTAPQRTVAESGRGRTLLVMPALRAGGLATVKIVTVLSGDRAGLSSHLMAFDDAGSLIAVVEAHELTARRTAAASVLAARTLGAGDARHLALLGAGRQARAQVEAYADAMPLETITVWARRDDAAKDLATFCHGKVSRVNVASSADEAIRHADIITCATASETPLILGDRVSPGTHIDLVGGFRPTMREADDAVMRRGMIVADTPAALEEAGDLLQPIASGAITRDDVILLADWLAGKHSARRGDITVFKSVGHAAEDLVVAELLLARLGLIPGASTPPGSPRPSSQGTLLHD